MNVTVKGILHWTKQQWETDPQYQIFRCDMSDVSPEYIAIKPVNIELEIPDDFDPVPRQIEALKAKKQEILADAQFKANNIEEQIQRLLCIEHKPEVA